MSSSEHFFIRSNCCINGLCQECCYSLLVKLLFNILFRNAVSLFSQRSCYVKNSGKLQILQNVLLLCINYLHKVPFIFFLLMVNSLYPSDSTSLPLSSLGFSHSNYTKPVICYVPSIAPWGQIKFFLNLNLNLNIAQVVLDF